MLVSSSPTRIPLIWASAVGGAYINPIPQASQISVKNGAASYTDGFPPLCFVPYATGGAGPFGADFNGILQQVTAGLQWEQAGGPNTFNSGFSTEIGGYPQGAVIPSATLGGLWQSTVDNNTADPDTGGTNWRALFLPQSRNIAAFGTPGTTSFTVPQGVYWATAIVTGGGGGGAGATTNQQGGCGGAAGTIIAICSVTPGAIITVTVGAGGAGVGANATGGTGGTSSFGPYASATGGTGGVNNSVIAPGGTPGIGVFGTTTEGIPMFGGGGSDGLISSSFDIGQGLGGASFWGGGGRQGSGGGVPGPTWGTGGGGSYNSGGVGGSGGTGLVAVFW